MRERLSYANVVATLALFLALGGGAVWAAGKIGSGEIKKDAVLSKHIKAGAVKGADVTETSLGQVPSAAAASQAANAAHAADADRVDGLDSADLVHSCPAGTAAFAGICVETAARGAALYATASSTCAGLGRRLPSFAELDGFRQQPGVDIGSNQFTSDHDIGAIGAIGSAVLLISDGGSVSGSDKASVPQSYRCVTGPGG